MLFGDYSASPNVATRHGALPSNGGSWAVVPVAEAWMLHVAVVCESTRRCLDFAICQPFVQYFLFVLPLITSLIVNITIQTGRSIAMNIEQGWNLNFDPAESWNWIFGSDGQTVFIVI